MHTTVHHVHLKLFALEFGFLNNECYCRVFEGFRGFLHVFLGFVVSTVRKERACANDMQRV